MSDSPEVARAGSCQPLTANREPLPVLRWLGRVEYEPTWGAMQALTDARTADTPDEIWFLEHPPVFTLGMNAAREHVLAPGDIPLVQIDRGGQVTYHGPGQLVVYPLLDLRRLGVGVRQLVIALESAIIDLVASWNIEALGRRDAPGVYVAGRKLASIGLRIRRSCSYHGLAFNIAMDLEPFRRINPCGRRGLEVIDLRGLGIDVDLQSAAEALAPRLLQTLNLPSQARWAQGSSDLPRLP
jgi:lipoyl(octanoyl) transferase